MTLPATIGPHDTPGDFWYHRFCAWATSCPEANYGRRPRPCDTTVEWDLFDWVIDHGEPVCSQRSLMNYYRGNLDMDHSIHPWCPPGTHQDPPTGLSRLDWQAWGCVMHDLIYRTVQPIGCLQCHTDHHFWWAARASDLITVRKERAANPTLWIL